MVQYSEVIFLDWRNDRAIFLQVIDLFKKDVVNGVYKPNGKIPSVREYALKLGINPNTVVKVYDILNAEGLIEARGTTGYFLTGNLEMIAKIKPEFLRQYCRDFLDSMADLGYSKEEVVNLLKESD